MSVRCMFDVAYSLGSLNTNRLVLYMYLRYEC